jgi:hypothetical protein
MRPICYSLLILATLLAIAVAEPVKAADSEQAGLAMSVDTEPAGHAALTLETVGVLWNARLRAACGLMGTEFGDAEQRCLDMALQSLTLALSHFQADDHTTDPVTALQQLDIPLPTELSDPGQRQAADHIRSLIQRVPIHPLCLDQLRVAWFDDTTLHDGFLICDSFNEAPIRLSESAAGGLLIWLGRPMEPDAPGSLGAIYYRTGHRQSNEHGDTYFLQIQSNTGGTGVFSSIWVLHQGPFSHVFEPRFHVPGGDRCNDGNIQVVSVSDDGQMVYQQNASPFRLFNPHDNNDQRMDFLLSALNIEQHDASELPESFMNLFAYRDVNNCAICCSGRRYTQVDLSTFEAEIIAVSIRNDHAVDRLFRDESLVECSSDWFDGLLEHETNRLPPDADYKWFAIDHWAQRLAELQQACADWAPEPLE